MSTQPAATSITVTVDVAHQLSTSASTSTTAKTVQSPTQHGMANQAAAATSTFLFYPLDVLKIRYMAQDGTATRVHNGIRYKNVMTAARSIREREGVSTFFRGVHLAVVGSAFSWGSYMYVYKLTEGSIAKSVSTMPNIFGSNSSTPTTTYGITSESHGGVVNDAAVKVLSSFFAWSCIAVVTNPLWMIKSRMQLEECQNTAPFMAERPPERRYRSTLNSIRCIVEQGRVDHHENVHNKSVFYGIIRQIRPYGALWRGTAAQIASGLPTAFSFPLYECLKNIRWRQNCGANDRSTVNNPVRETLRSTATMMLEACTMMGASKLCLAVAVHPCLVVRARQQDEKARIGKVQYVSFIKSLRTIIQREGLVGLYRGFLIGQMHSLPRSCCQVMLYEALLQQLSFFSS